jgi:O-antigen/teichoic acid export membrane protein
LAVKGLKEKAVTGMFWSFSDSMVTQLIQFIVGLILARLLTPSEFGLVGMITVFVAVSQSLVDSGFGHALIRKKDANEIDYSTVFYFNVVAGILIFLIFYLSAPSMARFYKQPELTDIARVLSIVILINATLVTQRTKLIKSVNLRQLMKVNLTAAIISGSVSIVLALKGFGVWSLVWRSLINSSLQAIMLCYTNRWIPSLKFSKSTFSSLFSFGSRLLVSGLLDTVYRNLYLLIIGKFFSEAQLGYYTRADQFSRLASQNLIGTLQRVSYPVLSMVQDENERLKSGYRKMIISTMFLTFFIMLGMAAIAQSMIITLIGEKWLPSVPYLQLLCMSAMLFPLHALNLNILNVKGRSDLYLRLEIINKLLAVPVILVGVYLGIPAMLIGMIVHSVISYFINSYYSGRMIGYSVREQIADILPSLLLAIAVCLSVYSLTFFLNIHHILMLTVQIVFLMVLTTGLSRLFKLEGYLEIRKIIAEKFPFFRKVL